MERLEDNISDKEAEKGILRELTLEDADFELANILEQLNRQDSEGEE